MALDQSWEHLFYQVRRGKAARLLVDSAIPAEPGALVDYPSHVSQAIAGKGNRSHTWPIRTDLEPGSWLPGGVHIYTWQVITKQTTYSGQWAFVVGEHPAPVIPASDAPDWVTNAIPSTIYLDMWQPATIRRNANRLIRQGETARNQAIVWGQSLVRRVITNNAARLGQMGGSFDEDDATQVGMARLVHLLDIFASAGRPECSWAYACLMDINRDLQRAMGRSEGESATIAAIRAWLWARPHVTTVQQAREAGLSKHSDEMVEFALNNHTKHISLDAYSAMADPADQVGQDHMGALGQQDPERDPLFGRSLVGALNRVGITLEEAEPWLYKIGAIDFPHTIGEVRAKYGKRASSANTVERRFFTQFARAGENWSNPDDRAQIRQRARHALVSHDTLVAHG